MWPPRVSFRSTPIPGAGIRSNIAASPRASCTCRRCPTRLRCWRGCCPMFDSTTSIAATVSLATCLGPVTLFLFALLFHAQPAMVFRGGAGIQLPLAVVRPVPGGGERPRNRPASLAHSGARQIRRGSAQHRADADAAGPAGGLAGRHQARISTHLWRRRCCWRSRPWSIGWAPSRWPSPACCSCWRAWENRTSASRRVCRRRWARLPAGLLLADAQFHPHHRLQLAHRFVRLSFRPAATMAGGRPGRRRAGRSACCSAGRARHSTCRFVTMAAFTFGWIATALLSRRLRHHSRIAPLRHRVRAVPGAGPGGSHPAGRAPCQPDRAPVRLGHRDRVAAGRHAATLGLRQ